MGDYDYYDVIDADSGITIAKHMPIEHALIFVKALFSQYWKETDIAYTIRKESVGETE